MKKWFKQRAQQLREQGYKHPWWALLLLFSGWLVAVVLMEQQEEDRTFLLDILTSIGTVAAALAAFWAANLTREAQQRQIDREREAQRPYLIFSHTYITIYLNKGEGYEDEFGNEYGAVSGVNVSFVVRNISQFPIVFHEVGFASSETTNSQRLLKRASITPAKGSNLVSPGAVKHISFFTGGFYFDVESGQLYLFVYHGASGSLVHTFYLNFHVENVEDEVYQLVKTAVLSDEPEYLDTM